MSNNTADTSVVDAVPASDSAAKRLTGDERRREILAAVRTVSSELGVSHLSVSAVTKRAGCTRSLFYHYFADMDAAVTAVMDEASSSSGMPTAPSVISRAHSTPSPRSLSAWSSAATSCRVRSPQAAARSTAAFCTTWSSVWRSISATPPWWILPPIMSYASTMSTRRSTPSSWGC